MMNEKPLILVVDDDVTVQTLFAATLEDGYQVVAVDSGTAALEAAGTLCPAVILLDVEMPPGIDGYETCRRLKDDETTAEIPVVFVSGRDGIEDRLKGYEAGGEDYLVKPFDAQELDAKLVHLLKMTAARAALKQMASYASSAAMTAMTSLSEMGSLLQAMKSFSVCTNYRELADALMAGLSCHGLRGVIQVRSPEAVITLSDGGEASPLEVSVIAHLTSMERIVQFKSRLSIAYPSISLLVQDMPLEDADRCGRLRDHLAMLAEGAEARAAALAAAAESARRGATIERAAMRISAALADIDRAQRESQTVTRLAVETITQRMETAFVSVAMSTAQEDYMADILREGIEHLLSTQTDRYGMQNQLSSIVQELKGIAA